MTEEKKSKGNCFFSIILLVIMSMSFSVSSYSQDIGEGNTEGIGNMEGIVKKDIFQVDMPINTDNVFNFILDPQGLINATDGAAYDGKKFEEDSTVFFKRSDGTVEEDYSNKSDPVTITNRSSVPVDVLVEVRIDPSSIEGITMSEDKEFKDHADASLYLAIMDEENVVPVGRDGASIQTTIKAAPEEAYEVVCENDEYVYKMKKNLDGIIFPAYSFQLTGAANGKGDWSELENISPKIVITWKVLQKEEKENGY